MKGNHKNVTGRRTLNRRVFRFKILGHLFGVWRWRRGRGSERPVRDQGLGFERYGIVARVGPLGHVQFSCKEKRWANGRRCLRSFGIHFWGVAGRRHKRGFDLSVFW